MRSTDVLVIHPDPRVRDDLRRALDDDPDIGTVVAQEDPERLEVLLKECSPAIVFVAHPYFEEVQSARQMALSDGLPVTIFIGGSRSLAEGPFTCLHEPLNFEELAHALLLAKEKVQLYAAREVIDQLESYIRDIRSGDQRPPEGTTLKNHFVVRAHGRIVLVSEDDVNWVSAERNYVRLHTDEREFLVRMTMQEMQERLSGHGFVRIHRSTMARLSYMDEIIAGSSGYEAIRLEDGTVRSLSASGRERLERALGRKL